MNKIAICFAVILSLFQCASADYETGTMMLYPGEAPGSALSRTLTIDWDQVPDGLDGVPTPLPSCPFTYSGHEFVGWQLEDGCVRPEYNEGKVYPAGYSYIAGCPDLILTAVWKLLPSVKVTLNTNGGSFTSGTASSISVTSGSAYGTLPTPHRTGYSFSGWYTALSGGSKVTSSTIFTGTSPQTLYARWTELPGGPLKVTTASASAAVELGAWHGGFDKCLAKADSEHVPLFAVWSISGDSCSYCNYLAKALNSDTFSNWQNSSSGKIILLNMEGVISPSVGNGYPFESAGYNWAKGVGTAEELNVFSYLAFYWNKGDGTIIRRHVSANQVTGSYSAMTAAQKLIDKLSEIFVASVRFNANGGSCSTSTKTFVYGSAYGDLPSPTRSGYTFAGWYTSSSGGTRVTASTVVTADITLYARWSSTPYTLTFNANGGSCTTSSKVVYFSSSYGTLPTPTRSGYEFLGWFTASSGGSQVSSGTIAYGSATVYAQWKMIGYTITFNANGGSVSEGSRVRSYNAAYGTLPTPTRTGYDFLGWYTSSSGGTQVSSTTPATASCTVYAHWTAKSYTLTFNANGGSCSTSSKSVTYDSTYGTLPTPTRDHATFSGWYTSASGGTQVSASTKVTGSATVYAHWNVTKYTLTFNANGGSCSTKTRSVEFGAAYGNLPTPTRTGYTFSSWYTATSGGSAVSSSTTMSTEGATVYARWAANTYTISYNANGGTGSMSATSATYGKSDTLRTNAFKRQAYRFMGWATSSTGSAVYKNGASVSNLTSTKGATFTLYAVWQPATIEVNSFRQRFPWNGLVDIEVSVGGDSGVDYPVTVQAIDGKGAALKVSTIGVGSADAGGNPVTVLAGTTRLVWNAAADLSKDFLDSGVRIRASLVTGTSK